MSLGDARSAHPHSTPFWGNEFGLVTKMQGPMGETTEVEFDAWLQKVGETDGLGNTQKWVRDEWGNCIEETDALGQVTKREFDREHRLVKLTDAAGGQWTIDYDWHGKPRYVHSPARTATQYTHDEQGRLLGVDDPMGRRMRFEWNERHDLVKRTDGEGRATTFEHDALGRVVGSVDAAGRITAAKRDALGRIVVLDRADGERLIMRHDADGNVLEQENGRGHRVRMRYAGLGRLVEHTDAMGYTTRLAYDSDEELIAVENQLGERYRFELDVAGRVLREHGFDGKTQRYYYDAVGRVKKVAAPEHKIVEIKRDALGRIVERKVRGEIETFAYSASGGLSRATTGDATVEFERDVLGQILREVHTSASGERHEVKSRYDHSGFRVERTTDLGHQATYAFDNAGDLTRVTAGVPAPFRSPELERLGIPQLTRDDWAVDITRDALGLEAERMLPGGVRASWHRDRFGKPTERRVTTGAWAGRRGTDVVHQGYQWHGPDQIAAILETSNVTRQTTYRRSDYQYDPRGHLVAAIFGDGRTPGQVQHRASDPAGNLFRTADGSDRRYGRGGRLERAGGTQYRYDAEGNLTEKLLADGARWQYRWNHAGRLASVVRPDGREAQFGYDALGRRVRKEFDGTVTEFVWDGDDLVHERVIKDGEVAPIVTWLFEPGMFAPLAKLEGQRRFGVVTDHLGTPAC